MLEAGFADGFRKLCHEGTIGLDSTGSPCLTINISDALARANDPATEFMEAGILCWLAERMASPGDTATQRSIAAAKLNIQRRMQGMKITAPIYPSDTEEAI